jgi:hypothetical protein
MWIARIEPDRPGRRRCTFECPGCRREVVAVLRVKPPAPPTHKFKLGDSVLLGRGGLNRTAPAGYYQVTKQLPEKDGEFEYHIKNAGEPHTRVARESELRRS